MTDPIGPSDQPLDEPVPPPTTTPPVGPPPGAMVALGPPGKTRSIGLVILVSIVTCGIWTIVWSFQNGEELKEHNRTGLGGVAYLFITLLISPVTMFLLPGEIEKMYQGAGKQSPVSAVTGCWFLLPFAGPFVWYIKVQNALNAHWQSLGAPAPSGL